MLNVIWVVLICTSCVYGFLTGRATEVGRSFFSGAENCVSFMLKTGSFMIMWQGILSVAQESGLSDKMAGLLSPVISKVFTGVKKGSHAAKLISNNITANMLGLSNAATPSGMEAMRELSKKSRSFVATDDMCMLSVINSASLQLIPSTLIAMRSTYQSTSPSEITVPIWIVSSLTVIFAVCMAKTMAKYGRHKL